MKKLFDIFILFNVWLDDLDNKHPNLAGFLGASALLAFYVITLMAIEKYGIK